MMDGLSTTSRDQYDLSASKALLPTTCPIEYDWATEEAFFVRLSRQFTLDPEVVYFMAGQKGSMPSSVLRRLKMGLTETARSPFSVFLEPIHETRRRIAECYGADTDEIAISRNTSDGISLILGGIDWKAGDEILVSPLEHPAGVAPVLRIASRFKLVIRQWGVPVQRDATSEEVVDALKRQLRPGVTRAVFLSSPSCTNGQRMPERLIAAAAQEAGAITIVDGAHYSGMIDPRLKESGIDFWALAGHKWQCGSGGTGIIYARNRENGANATPPPTFHLIRSSSLECPIDGSRPRDFDIGSALSNYGYPESADWRALADVCEMWGDIGRDRIQCWTHNLADYLRQKIENEFGKDALLQPTTDPSLKSAIVAFNPFPSEKTRVDYQLNSSFRERLLAEYGFQISGGGLGPNGLTRFPNPEAASFPVGMVPNRDPLSLQPAPFGQVNRINACIWNSRSDVDQFIAATSQLIRQMLI